MRSLYPRIMVALAGICIVFFGAVVLSHAEDYLVIKRKGGPTQKVPLKFSPEDIESFHVESGPGGKPPTKTESRQPAGAQQNGSPMILKQGPTGTEQPATGSDRSSIVGGEEKSQVTEQPPATTSLGPGAPVSAPKKQPSSLVAAALPGGKGTFSVNLYKLPKNISALPDYSALSPSSTTTADKIDLDPVNGENEPAINGSADGLGMRSVGMFLVSGEGIFRWRLYSKDGARLNIDDKTLIENDGIHDPSSKTGYVHLGQGMHTIILDSFNSKGSPVLKIFVQPPVGKEQIFSLGSGLAGWKEPSKPYDVLWGEVYFIPKGNYPDGPDFNRLSPIGRLISPELNITGGDSFPGLPGRNKMVGLRYQGFFSVHGAGIFAFRLVADHYARLIIGKHNVVEVRSSKSEPNGKIGWAFLQKGSYPITLDYFHAQGNPKLELYVTSPTKKEELFSPARPLDGFVSQSGKVNLIPGFVYFVKPGIRKIPNFNKESPSGMFFTKAINYPVNRGSKEFPGIPKREDWVGIRFYVKFALSDKEAGKYKFRVAGEGAARLIIAKKMIINAEGPSKTINQSGTVTLPAGSHEMFLDYLQTTGPDGVQLYITPPGGQEKIFAFQ
jgi:PA14 domain